MDDARLYVAGEVGEMGELLFEDEDEEAAADKDRARTIGDVMMGRGGEWRVGVLGRVWVLAGYGLVCSFRGEAGTAVMDPSTSSAFFSSKVSTITSVRTSLLVSGAGDSMAS
jgi:hypothetical protein